MFIDLNKANVEDLVINKNISYDKEFYEKSSIKNLDTVVVNGKITLNDYNELNLLMSIEGNMYLEDAINLELIKYPFNIEVEETILDNDEYFCISNNKMDLKEFVWKNIALEIPIRVVSKENINQTLEGEGWSLNKEQEETNSFSKLNELFENKEN